MSDTLEAAFYPRYCFHLAPTANAWCFFQTRDLFTLEQREGFEGEGLYFYRNLPIKWVRIVGVVVAIDEFAGLCAFTIDDSSGACIEAVTSLTAPAKPPDDGKSETTTSAAPAPAPALGPLAQPVTPYGHVDVGSVVDVKGALTTFREARQLKVEKMLVLRSTAEEMKLWTKRTVFRRDVLERPWIVPDKMLRRCRRDAERTEAEAERKRQRLKAAMVSRTATRTSRAKKAQRGEGTAEDDGAQRRSRSRGNEADVAEILASAKGKYSALGL
ncbi:hypothetical protein PWT90_01894 [Aphanocladium album]|nr:hypothetical protein PWT90_01894 [Aphanocladium album]